MDNLQLLQNIDDLQYESEINVLAAIGECYQKAINMLFDDNCDIKYIQETFNIYQESNVVNSIKELFNKVINFFKSVFDKLNSYIKRSMMSKENIYTANMLMIYGTILETKPSPSVQQEAAVMTTKALRKESDKRKASFEKEQNKIQKEVDRNNKKIETRLHKYGRTTFNDRPLRDEEVKEIAQAVVDTAAKRGDLEKIMSDIEHSEEYIKSSILSKFSQKLVLNHNLAKLYRDSKIDFKKEHHRIMKMKKAADKINTIEPGSDKEKELEMDLKLINDFANSLGQALDSVARTNEWTPQKLYDTIYGGGYAHRAGSLLKSSAKTIFGMVKNAPEILKYNAEFNSYMYDMHHAYMDAYEKNKEIRKEMDIHMNKLIGIINFVVLDNIKEETYGRKDCPWNSRVDAIGDPAAFAQAGPFTMAFKILQYVITGDNGMFFN